eukprot:CAMPEP_0202906884 /NCGR_PEP_ID=MMETSP1392-20130828/40599_1 /ASSEMBLY_ACC=CAM_ASM_000868 /TAXON_ID=225041 /ORGANISM="Chlamydomonas chlamydogama, Strain SAG 11-48b" /LENGTH=944 /DNA_ID=CAMNT_0049595565 /DNA_START=401 /DNA_END=3235 /DNA_ORIENTATION=+
MMHEGLADAQLRRMSLAWEGEKQDMDQIANLAQDVRETAEVGFAQIARVGMLSASNSPLGRWLRGGGKATASTAAKRMREAARLKALQRTPYPMVLARIKLLLDRLQLFKMPVQGASKSPSMHHSASIKPRPSLKRGASVAQSTTIDSVDEQAGLATSFDGDATIDPSTFVMEDGMGNRLSLDKIMEELGTTFAYVSEFLRKVPEHTRTMSILWAKMENFKKDQTVYMSGDDPEKFYIILTGTVEVWTHPPGNMREKTLIATLKKGQSFGDQAILNNEVRSDCVTPTNNCTFLTVDRHAFMDIFGGYFNEKLKQAQEFFRMHVDMFKKVPREDADSAVRHMLLTTYPAGREWDPYNEQQIYFIKEGTCTLECHDRKFVVRDTPRILLADAGDAPAMADSGVLANVVIRDGRAVGTLGHEEELRRLRRSMIPKKAIATLTSGGHFGGGALVMGEGELQSSLKVLADTELEVYHMHVDLFFKKASGQLVSALRDDVSFKLTYYYGRIGTIAHDMVVGHADALLYTTMRKQDEDSPVNLSATLPATGNGVPWATGSGAATAARIGRNGPARRKRNNKQVHEPGQYSPEVEKALQYIAELQNGTRPDMDKHMQLIKDGVTPSERFWSAPAVSGTARSNAINPLLSQVYPEGLAPLAEKIDELIERTARYTIQDLSTSPPGSPQTVGAPQRYERMRLLSSLTQSVGVAEAPAVKSPTRGGVGQLHSRPSSSMGPARPIERASEVSEIWRPSTQQSAAEFQNRPSTAASASSPFAMAPRQGRRLSTLGAAEASSVSFASSLTHQKRMSNLGTGLGGGASSMQRLQALQPLPLDQPVPLTTDWDDEAPALTLTTSQMLSPSRSPLMPGATDAKVATRKAHPGSLTAASVMWERGQEVGRPSMRQCLTYEEIAWLKHTAYKEPDRPATAGPPMTPHASSKLTITPAGSTRTI